MELDFDKNKLIKLINYYLINDDRKPLIDDNNYQEFLKQLFKMGLIDLKEIVYQSHGSKYLDIQITEKGNRLINTVNDFLKMN